MLLAAPELDRGGCGPVPGDMRHADGDHPVRIDRDLRDGERAGALPGKRRDAAWRPVAGCSSRELARSIR